MPRHSNALSALIEEGMNNLALSLDEERVSEHALKAIDYTERVCAEAFSDGCISREEAVHIRQGLRLIRASTAAQLVLDRRDQAVGRGMNAHLEVVARQRAVALQ